MIASSTLMKGGTMMRKPLSNSAGLKDFDAVCPLTTGSVSVTVQVTFWGRDTLSASLS